MERSYKYIGYAFIVLIPLTLLGFYKTYFNQFPSFSETKQTSVHLHAMIASIWIIMLIVQPILITKRKIHAHRMIGKASYIVFPLLILSFIPQMLRTLSSSMPEFIFFPVADSIALIIFYVLAIYHRKNMPKHMRYMIGTAIVFLGPTIGRIGPLLLGLSTHWTQNLMYVLVYLILIPLISMDRKNRVKPQPFIVILIIWVIHQISFNLFF